MRKKCKMLAWGAAALFLLAVNVQLAYAHNWWNWHWDKNPVYVLIPTWTRHFPQHVAAVADWDSHISHMSLQVNFKHHTDVSLLDGNFGATGWWGLATIENYEFDWWHLWCW